MMSMGTVTEVIHCFYSSEGVMKSINEQCDWKASSSLIKELRFHIYELSFALGFPFLEGGDVGRALQCIFMSVKCVGD